jgi:hypothetical protein
MWNVSKTKLNKSFTRLAAWLARVAVLSGLVMMSGVASAAPVAHASGPNLGIASIGPNEYQLFATGGDGNYSWSLVPGFGTLPPGMAIRTDMPSWFSSSASAGLIGVSTVPGTYHFRLRVSSAGLFADQDYTFTISTLVVKEYQVIDAYVGEPYSYVMTAQRSGADVSASWQATGGSYPSGVSLSPGGVLQGTPTVPGSYNFYYSVTQGGETIFKGSLIVVNPIHIRTEPLPNARQGNPYTATITATGGSGNYTFSYSGGLPAGILPTNPPGTISGTPVSGPGVYTPYVTVTDNVSHLSVSKSLSLDLVGVPPALPLIWPYGNLFWDVTVGQEFSQGIAVRYGGRAPFTWNVAGLPQGLSFRSAIGTTSSFIAAGDLEIWGAVTVAGTYNIAFTVTDADGLTASNTFALHVSTLALTNPLANGTLGSPYSSTMRITGGTMPYDTAQIDGRLPQGLTLTGSTQLVSGIPAESGNFNARFHFADAAGNTLDSWNGFFIGGPTITISNYDNLGAVTVGSGYSNQLFACCANSINWSVVDPSTLPPGMGLSPGGQLSGTPTTIGTYVFTVRAVDASNNANFALHQFTLVVTPLRVTTNNVLPFGNVGAQYGGSPAGFQLQITGGTGPWTYTLMPGGYLPPGIGMSLAGIFTGVPTATGQYQFNVKAADSAGHITFAYFSLSIYPAGSFPPPGFNFNTNLGTWSIGQVDGVQLTGTGGNGTYTFSFEGGILPPGLSIRTDVPSYFPAGASGLIGVATTPGTYTFQLGVTSAGVKTVQTFTMKIVNLVVKNLYTQPDTFIGQPFSFQLIALRDGQPVPATWTATSALPPGVFLSASGELHGTPTSAGFFNINFNFSDGSDTVFRSINYNTFAINITTSGDVLANATQGAFYSTPPPNTTGGSGVYTYSVSGTTAGLTLNTATGVLSGTIVNGPGTFTYILTATDSANASLSYSKHFTGNIVGQVAVLPQVTNFNTTTSDCTIGVPCSRSFGVQSGGTAPFTWTEEGLPPGMDIQWLSGTTSSYLYPTQVEIWGTPVASGTFNVKLTVTDALGVSASQTFPVVVSELLLTTFFTNGTIETPYSQGLRVIGGAPGYTATQTAGALPNGLSVASATQVVSGTPHESGAFNTTLLFTDTVGRTIQNTFFYNISSVAGKININNGSDLGFVSAGSAFSRQLTASAAACCASGLTWTLFSGSLPPGISISAGGLLSGTPTANGIYTFVIRATDSGNAAWFAGRQFTLNVTPLNVSSSLALPVGNVGVPYSTTPVVTGGTGAVTWTLSPANFLPPGLSVVGGTTIAGTPTSPGFFSFAMTASDSAGHVMLRNFTLSIYPRGVPPPINATSIGPSYSFAVGVVNNIQLTATGGAPSLHFSITPGWAGIPGMRIQEGPPLPTFFPLSVAAGYIGVVTTPGTFNTSIRVTDANGSFVDRQITVLVQQVPLLSQVSLPRATVGVPYSFTLSTDPYGERTSSGVPNQIAGWSATGLPPGLSLDGFGRITGTPTVAGVFAPTLTSNLRNWSDLNLNQIPDCDLTNAAANGECGAGVTNSPLRLGAIVTIDPYVITNSGILPAGSVGTAYNQTLAAPGCGAGCNFTVIQGALPSGLTLNNAGLLSGTPASAFAGTFTVQVAGSNGVVLKFFSLLIANTTQPLTITNGSSLGTATVGSLVANGIFATGGTPPYNWSIAAGALPTGVTLQGPGLSTGCLVFEQSTASCATPIVLGAGATIGTSQAPGVFYLAGRLRNVGQSNFTLQVTDSLGAATSKVFTWTVSPLNEQYVSLPLSIGSPATVVMPLVYETSYAQPLLALGGTGPYTWTNLAPLPTGLTLDPVSGVVSGTPLSIGSFAVPIQVADTANAQFVSNVVFNIQGPTQTSVNFGLGSTSGALLILNGVVLGGTGTYTFNPTGGTGPYTITALTPLPPGCALETGNAVLSGAGPYVLVCSPQVSGTFTFTLEIRDSSTPPNVGARTFQLTALPITLLSPTVLAPATLNVPYSQSLLAFDNNGPVTWSATSPLPAGLLLSSSGVISGIPTATAPGNFSANATDVATGVAVTFGFSISVSPLAITDPQVLPTQIVGAPVSYTFNATGLTAAPNWTANGLPAFLTVDSSSGLLRSTGTSSAGLFTFVINLTSGASNTSRRFTLFIRQPNPTILDYPMAPTLLPDVAAGQAFLFTLNPSGGMPPYSWGLGSGSTLPPGLSLIPTSSSGSPIASGFTPATTILGGVPTTTGRYAFDLIVTDSVGASTQRSFTLNVSGLNILQGAPRSATTGVAYAEQFTAVGGTPPYTFSAAPQALGQDTFPPGFVLSASGLLSGTTSSSGGYAFILTVRDSAGLTFSRTYVAATALLVNNSFGLRVTSTNPFDRPLGAGGGTLQSLTTSGASSYSWSVTPGSSLPPGLSIQSGGPFLPANTTLVVGQPTSAGVFTFSLRATDNANTANFADHTFTLKVPPQHLVSPPLRFLSQFVLPGGQVGVPYSFRFRMAGGTAPYTFSDLGAFGPLPPGLTLSADGVLSGMPLAIGNYSVGLFATDAAGNVGTIPSGFTLTVTAPGAPTPLIISTNGGNGTGAAQASVGVPYVQPLDFFLRGGQAPFTWSVASGSLPPGLTFVPGSNGVSSAVAGIPSIAGTYNFTVTVTDATGQIVPSTPAQLTVSPLALKPGAVPPGVVGVPYSVSLVPSGGTGPYTFQLDPTFDLPPGLALSAAGVLSGTPTIARIFNVGVLLADAGGANTLYRLYRITIDDNAGEVPAVTLSPNPIQVNYLQGAPGGAAIPLTIATTSAPEHFNLLVAGLPGASTAPDGTAPAVATLSFDAATLASGIYSGALGISVPDAANLYDVVPVVLNVAPSGSDRTPPAIGPVSDIGTEATSAAGAIVTFATPGVTDDFYPAPTVSVAPSSGSVFPIGVTLVTVTATDSSGNVSQKTFNVTVSDTTAPVLTLPANISAEATSAAGALVNYSATALDVVDGPMTPNCVPASAGTFAFGVTTVNCSVTDAHGNTASGSFTVAVADTVGPSIAGAPGDRVIEATSAAGAVVSWTSPTATDVVDGVVAVSCTPASGRAFPIGTTPGTCTAVDSHGNLTVAAFTVTVQDTTPPVVAIAAPTEGTVYSLYEYVTASYNCADAVGLAACSAPVANGNAIDTSTKGPHVFRVSATDISHLSSFVEVHYTVVAPPTITVTSPSEPIYELGSTLLAQYTCADAVTCVGDTDNGTVLDTQTPGYKYLTITATDVLGNMTSTVVVYAVSYGAPIAPIAGLTAWLAGDGSATDELSTKVATWTATPAYAPGKVGQAFSVSAGNTVSFPIAQPGPFTLQAWVRTANPKQPYGSGVLSTGGPGQQATSAQIELDGAGNYQLNTGNGDLVLFIGPAADSFHHLAVTYDGSIVITYFDGQPVLGDFWLGSADLGILALNLGLDRGGSSPFGGLLDEVQVFGRALSAGEIQRTFLAGASGFVKDHAPVAVIALGSSSPAEATGASGATMRFDGRGSNDADGDALTYSWHEGSTVLGTGSQLSTPLSIGSHQITLTVDDGHFKTGSADITVVVQDTTPPIISGSPTSFSLEATSAGGAVATWMPPTATDIVDGVVGVLCVPVSGTTLAVGTTTVTCTATDSHSNAARVSFDVTVSDTKPPVLAGVPSGITSEATDSSGAVVSWTATAIDAVDGSVAVTCVPSAGSVFAFGTTHVECSAVDGRGNRASAGFDVVVQDTTPPVISGVPSVLIVEATSAAGATTTWSAPTAVDVVDGSVPAICSPAPGSLFAPGNSTVSCSATDSRGNRAEARFTVRVVDTVGPALTLPASVVAEAMGPLGTAVSYVVSATDVVSGAVPVSCAPASGSTFGVGLTAVTCSAADGAGNVTVGEFPVVVRDTTPPVGQVITPSADALLTSSPVTVTVQATDIVGVASVVVNGTPASLASGTSLSGTWTATVPVAIAPETVVEFHAVVSDASGNSIETIRVVDNDGIQSQAPPAALAPFGLDRGRTSGDDLSNAFSSEFNNGLTAGAITRNGWTATLSASAAPARPVTVPPSAFWPASGWVQVGISGSPNPAAAIVGACVGGVKQIRLNVAGERGVFACDPVTGTIAFKALSALPMIEVWKQLTSNVWLAIPVMTGGGISTGSPTTAFPDNPGPIDVKVIRYDDSGSPRTVGTFRLEPGATADVQVTADAAGRDDQFVFRALYGRVPIAMGNVLKTLEPGGSTTMPVDRTPPEIAVGVPRADAVYLLHQAVTGSFSCSDEGSGIASCDGPSASGQPVPTAAVGASAFSVVAVDRAGNSRSLSIPYAVTYAVELAGGEGQAIKNGSLRLSLRLADALGMNQSADSIPVRATALVSVDGKTRVELQDQLEFDPRSAAYDLDLKAAGLSAGDYRLDVEIAGDRVPHPVLFHVKQSYQPLVGAEKRGAEVR